jgi:hypothetical protein
VGPEKNRFETWQIFSAKIGVAKTPQNCYFHHEFTIKNHPLRTISSQKPLKNSPPSPGIIFGSAREQQQSLQAQPGRTQSEEP